MAEDTYSLVFFFDRKSISEDDLRQKVEKAISSRLKKVQPKISRIDNKRLQLSIKGTLGDVESCRDKINTNLKDYPHILLIDEAANEIRQQAYPILAKIELSLREFINRAISEIFECDWWNTMATYLSRPDVQQAVLDIKKPKPYEVYHPLDLLYFGDLARLLITGYYQELREDKLISVDDLIKILNGC